MRLLLVHEAPVYVKVLEDAAAIDAKYEAGESITPLCGLAFAVKVSMLALQGCKE